jgi:O-antigen ligase
MAAALIGLSLIGNRALSFDRLADLDAGEDVRVRALPVVWQMVRDYFPSGAGGGAFEPLFRLHEPFALLKPTYFNHAHDDFLELLVEHGIAGAVLVLAGLAWVVRLSVGVWRGDGRVEEVFRGRLGSAVILLMLVASITDYPLRTPLVMAILVLAAAWLADGGRAAKLYRAAG